MQIDKYTKTVLTIIAACLLWISLVLASSNDFVHSASAQVPKQPMQVILAGVGPNFAVPVNLVAVDSKNQAVPVSILSVESANHTLPVDLTYVGGGHHPLPVKVVQ